MTLEEREVVVDMFTMGLEPKDISYSTGLKLREVRFVCEEYENQTWKERYGFMRELKDKGCIQGKRFKWRWSQSKLRISY